MMTETMLKRVLIVIGAITVVTGLTQLVAPRWMLGMVGADLAVTSAHFFATVGMFMVLFGGMLVQALRSPQAYPIVVFWVALQKLGAAVLVFIGVQNGVFGALALGVSGFDLLSGVLAFWYWRKIKITED